MSHFSEKIKSLRQAAGLTQKVIAEKIGISQGNYSGLEKGKFDPSLTTLEVFLHIKIHEKKSRMEKISNFYDVSIDELVTTIRFPEELSDEAKSIAKRYDMLPFRDQFEILRLMDIKMRWYNEDYVKRNGEATEETLENIKDDMLDFL